MEKVAIYIMALIQIAMTVLLTYDFFPDMVAYLAIPKTTIFLVLLVLISANIFFSRWEIGDLKETMIWQIISVGYLLLVVVVFNVLGGVSQVGISLGNPIFWVIVGISINEIYQRAILRNSNEKNGKRLLQP